MAKLVVDSNVFMQFVNVVKNRKENFPALLLSVNYNTVEVEVPEELQNAYGDFLKIERKKPDSDYKWSHYF